MWREIEEESSRTRIPAILKAIEAGDDAVFVHKTWGKETGMKIAINRNGITATHRYKEPEFREWRQIKEITIKDDLIISDAGESEPWINEPLLAMPGYVALKAAADCAREIYRNSRADGGETNQSDE